MRTRFHGLEKAVAIATLLAFCESAMAANILRRASPRPAAAQALSSDAAAAATAAAQAQAVAQQSRNPLRRAMDAVKLWQAGQDAARAAQAPAAGDPPDGLVPGGLEVARGAAAGSPEWQGADLPWWQQEGDRTSVTVKQNEEKAILTWQTFNVGRGTDLHFDQRAGGSDASGWIALNRVIDPSGSPSQILGSIAAEGRVYVINRNGIIFGGSSQVNVASLIASSLDFKGETIEDRNAVFRAGLPFTFEREGSQAGAVTVEAGAKISVGNHGQVALLGENVVNAGSLEAPDGQVVLAAGSEVTLERDSATNRYYATPTVTPIEGAGEGPVPITVENQGIISTPRGNVTMVAGGIRQDGLVTATTSVEVNGSIWLGSNQKTGESKQPSAIWFGEGSVTQVLPDEDSKKVVGTATLPQSKVDVSGEKIYLLDGSTIYVPAGLVKLSTQSHVQWSDTWEAEDDQSRIYLGEGARIDVSGLSDVEVAMEQNEIKGELRANELADNPVLRASPLRSRTVYFDARLGGKLRDGSGVADLSGYYGLQERDVEQLMTSGGSVNLTANEIITRPGSQIDLSGGSLSYRDGYVRSTQLIDPTGKRVRIEDADAGVRYVGIDGDTVVDHARWGVSETYTSGLSRSQPHFEKGYVEGGSAGTLTMGKSGITGAPGGDSGTPAPAPTGAFRIFDGEIRAETVVGPKQRELQGALDASDPTQAWRMRPSGGVLVIGGAGDIAIADVGTQLGDFGPDSHLEGLDSLRYRQVLPSKWFDGRTFTNVTIESGYTDDRIDTGTAVTSTAGTKNSAPGGNLTIGEGVGVDLGDGGSFSFKGKRADIDGTLLAPGGKVSITTLDLPKDMTEAQVREAGLFPTTRVGATGVIDVAGRWSNDHLDGATAPLRALDGGAVTLTASHVVLEQGSLVDVSGGGRLDATGTKVKAGNGGSITIDVSKYANPGGNPPDEWSLDGELRGYALGTGGTLALVTRRDIVIDLDEPGRGLPAGAGPSYHLLTPDLFTQGGFSTYRVTGQSVTVGHPGPDSDHPAQLDLTPSVKSLVLPTWAAELPTGTLLADVAAREVLTDPSGQYGLPMKLVLSAGNADQSGTVTVQAGVKIAMAPESTVQLSGTAATSGTQPTVYVDGTIEAPGGTIALKSTNANASDNDSGIIALGPSAELLARGYQKETYDGALIRRSVEPGGAITMGTGSDSYDLLEVRVDPGSRLDVSGVPGTADLTSAAAGAGSRSRYVAEEVDGSAGAISISAIGGVLAGRFQLEPGGETGEGGSLDIRGPHGIVVRQEVDGPAEPGKLVVVAQRVDESSADDVVLRSRSQAEESANKDSFGGTIEFDGLVELHARRSLALYAPRIAAKPDPEHPAQVTLDSDYVLIEGIKGTEGAVAPAVAPGSTLSVNANLIDLRNQVTLGRKTDTEDYGGFETARFHSGGDIRLSSTSARNALAGLLSPGAIALEAAQVYVTSPLQLSGALPGSTTLERDPGDPGFLIQGKKIKVTRVGDELPQLPLSFGERLTLRAETIEQDGVLRAPQGQIRLEGDSVTLGPTSVTSVSLEGSTVPFGEVTTRGEFVGYDQPGSAPTKSVTIDGKDVEVQAGAVVDVSGGGDLLGFSFAPGNGGSKDVLNQPNTFAVLPSVGAGPAPLGGTDSLRDPSLKVGDSVYLQGVPGLADGTYTLLPAHYALLPGGLLVKDLKVSFASAAPSFTRPDGAVVASGYRTVSGTPIRDPGYSRFVVMSQDAFGQYSQIVTYRFDEVARARDESAGLLVRTPGDAGTVALKATESLELHGTGRFEAGEDGLLGNLDISAPKIAVVGPGRERPDESYLALDVEGLTTFGAGSVLLGGTRAASTDPDLPGTAVTVSATDVLVDTGGSAWTAPEIILAAGNSVTIRDGSVIEARGAVSRDAHTLRVSNDATIAAAYGSADGALLRLSTGSRVDVARAYGASATRGLNGTLTVGAASLSADGSLALDGSKGVDLATDARLSARQLGLSSARVNLGDVPEADRGTGTTLGPDALARLSSSSDLLVRGYDSIHLYLHGDVALGARDASGAATLEALTLDTGLLQGHAGDGETGRITAGSLTLRNSGGGGTGTSGAGTLALDADTLYLGPGDVKLAGFGSLAARAGAIEAQGAGSLDSQGSAALEADQVRAASGAGYTMRFAGDATLARRPGAGTGTGAKAVDALGLGGRITVEASSIAIDTSIALPAGTFEATATNGGVTLGRNAEVDVRGRAVDFDDQVRFAPGGAIRLSARGDLAIEAGARLDASASDRGGDAGSMELSAGGLARLDGEVRAAAAEGYRGGSFALDAGSVTDLSGLNGKLEESGFSESRELRLRRQDIALGAGEKITAHEVVLRSDSGSVSVRAGGLVDASGDAVNPDGGRIQLVGGNGVVVEGTLDAHAYGGDLPADAFDPRSGEVELVATGGRIDVAPGAVVDVSGRGSEGGSVVVRAPRSADATGVAVDRLAGDFRGAREVIVQGVETRDLAPGADAGMEVSGRVSDAASWLATNQEAIVNRLAGSSASLRQLLQVGAGIVVRSDGDMAIGTAIDLHGQLGPGYLGFVAGGDIGVNAAVSDGFTAADRATGTLLANRSASYGLDAGDDVVLAPGAMIRTGTGDISIRAGRNVELKADAVSRAVIYTAGMRKRTGSDVGSDLGWERGFGGAPSGMTIGEFPIEGGNIDIRAGGDIRAPLTTQTTSAWLFRYGAANWESSSFPVTQQTSWSIVFKNFEQGVGALGGGDVRVKARGTIDQLQVSIPTTGQLTTAVGEVADEGDLVVRGGGDLDLSAGRDILGGLFVLGRGHADLRAGGSVVAGSEQRSLRTETGGNSSAERTVGALFGLADATASVTAASTLEIEGAFDPLMQGQVRENLAGGVTGSAFSGYTERTALEATSLAGSVSYENDPWASADLSSGVAYQVRMRGTNPDDLNTLFGRAPGTLRLASLESSAFLEGRFAGGSGLVMAPAARGNLEVLAKGDVRIALDVKMGNLAPAYRRGPLHAYSSTRSGDVDRTTSVPSPPFELIHAGDPDPVRIYALEGSVCANLTGACVPGTSLRQGATPTITLPKPIDVLAGEDVYAGSYVIQHNGPEALSRIRAGRDIYDVGFQVSGVGAAMLEAGRDVVQHLPPNPRDEAAFPVDAQGGLVYSKGNTKTAGASVGTGNPALPGDAAADIFIMAGRAGGVDYDAFAGAYLDPANGRGVAKTYLPELAEYMRGLGYGAMSDADLVAAFGRLAPARREIFLDRVYFTELKEAGIEHNDPSSERFQSYDRGLDAVKLLFPTDPPAHAGDVILAGKLTATNSDADITILAPYGKVEVGTAFSPGNKYDANGGVLTRRGGDIRIMSDGNIDLFTSRVFTLQGGDITMWTSNGSITAGAGSKTSVRNVTPSYSMSADGVVTVNIFGLSTGAGIGVLDALQDVGSRPPSRLDLIAPEGEVNAGDAGIRVVGDLNIAAAVVVGMENIQSTGTATGVPKVEAPSIAALTTASQVAQAAAKEGVGPQAAAARSTVADLPSIITVEVVGYETAEQRDDKGERKKGPP